MHSIRAGVVSLALALLVAACADGPTPTSPDASLASVAGTHSPPVISGLFTEISNPDEAYVTDTDLIDISNLVEYADYREISDEVQTASFLFPMEKRTADENFADWSSTPYTEGGDPDVLVFPPSDGVEATFEGKTVLQVINLSEPSSIFGFELQTGNSLGQSAGSLIGPLSHDEFGIIFYHGAIEVGRVYREAEQEGGARLFAIKAAAGVPVIDRAVVIGEYGFAIARVRYATEYFGAESLTDAFDGLLLFLDVLRADGKLETSQYVLLRTQVSSAYRTADRGNFEKVEFQMQRFLTYASARNLPAADMAIIEDLVASILDFMSEV